MVEPEKYTNIVEKNPGHKPPRTYAWLSHGKRNEAPKPIKTSAPLTHAIDIMIF